MTLRLQRGRFAFEGLERALHERARLGIMTALVTHPAGLRFADLKQLCALTDGNLSRHLDVLLDAKLIEVWKGTEHRRPQTRCRLTPEGRRRFARYLTALNRVVRHAMSRASKRIPEKTPPPGFSPAA